MMIIVDGYPRYALRHSASIAPTRRFLLDTSDMRYRIAIYVSYPSIYQALHLALCVSLHPLTHVHVVYAGTHSPIPMINLLRSHPISLHIDEVIARPCLSMQIAMNWVG